MLDLQPGVHLEKGDRVGPDEKLHGGQAGVADRAGQRHRGLGQPGADRVADRGRGDLDQLLTAPLQAAVAVAQHRHGAGAVADDLDLDVPGPGQQLLDVHRAVTEGRRRLGGAPPHRRGEIGLLGHRPQAAPANTEASVVQKASADSGGTLTYETTSADTYNSYGQVTGSYDGNRARHRRRPP